MDIQRSLLVFLILIVAGVTIEGVTSKLYYQHKGKSVRKHFTFIRYLFLILFPVIGVLVSTFIEGITALKMFLLFSLLGPIFEWCIGYSYRAIVGQKLWTYNRYSISGYTSVLTLPLWGFAGILFYYLAKIV